MEPGMATNPIIPGFHPDPTICRVGGDFYLACSSFEYWPGLPIFHSRDLVHWRQIGNAIERPEQLRIDGLSASAGLYAPTLRFHHGRFWLVCAIMPEQFTFVVSAENPAGPWSDPIHIGLGSIDHDLAWDEDGTCIVTFAGIEQATVDLHSGAVLEPATPVWSGTDAYPEGPHLYHIDGRWYLMIAEGGTERAHAISIARGDSPRGPFTAHPVNPILTHRGRTLPVQNTGHGDLVQLEDGTWWMVLLGVRPRGMTPGFHVLGRETFLTRVHWRNGWPFVDDVTLEFEAPAIEPHPWPAAPVRDDFGDERLGPQWVSPRRRRPEDLSLEERPGWLRLHGGLDELDDLHPVFVGRRQEHLACRAAIRVEGAAREVGLAIRLDERQHAEVVLTGGRIVARARIGPLRQELASIAVAETSAILSVEIHPAPPGAGPDIVHLGYLGVGGFATLAELDGRYLSTEVAGGFTGRVIGAFAVDGVADVDWFDYEPIDLSTRDVRPPTLA
jgi:xylan 1,4-beta-xylosidase